MARHCLLLLSLLFASHPVFSQSVVIGAPSTDITSRGEAMLAHERQFNRFQSGRYWNSFTFGTYGLSKNTELAATLYGVGRPASGNVALGGGLKHRWGPSDRFRLALGGHRRLHDADIVFRLRRRWLGLGNVSLRAPGTKTRVTAGPSYGTSQIFGRRTYSTMLAVEQPVSKHFSIVSDLFSGTHDLAAVIGGFA